jgi:hypothetical protein
MRYRWSEWGFVEGIVMGLNGDKARDMLMDGKILLMKNWKAELDKERIGHIK